MRDEFQNPVEGATVTWASLTAGASVASATSTSTTDGIATVVATLGPAQDVYLFRAGLEGTAVADTLGVLGVVTTTDPTGDAGPTGDTGYHAPDAVRIGAALVDGVLVFYARFADPIEPPVLGHSATANSMMAWFDLDLDQDTLTGAYSVYRCYYGAGAMNFGADAWIDLDPSSPDLSNFQNPPAGSVPVVLIDALLTADRCGSVSAYGYLALPTYTSRSEMASSGMMARLLLRRSLPIRAPTSRRTSFQTTRGGCLRGPPHRLLVNRR